MLELCVVDHGKHKLPVRTCPNLVRTNGNPAVLPGRGSASTTGSTGSSWGAPGALHRHQETFGFIGSSSAAAARRRGSRPASRGLGLVQGAVHRPAVAGLDTAGTELGGDVHDS